MVGPRHLIPISSRATSQPAGGPPPRALTDHPRPCPPRQCTWHGRKEIGELLIAKVADVNAEDEDGYTPLDLAVSEGKKETADLLRKHSGKSGKK